MTTSAATARSRSYAQFAPLALLLVCLLWAYWPVLVDLALTWNNNPQYSHGFLVPVFAGVLLWLRRDSLDVENLRPSAWGFALLALGLSMRLIGAYRYYVSLDPFSLLPTVAGLVLLLGGRAAW